MVSAATDALGPALEAIGRHDRAAEVVLVTPVLTGPGRDVASAPVDRGELASLVGVVLVVVVRARLVGDFGGVVLVVVAGARGVVVGAVRGGLVSVTATMSSNRGLDHSARCVVRGRLVPRVAVPRSRGVADVTQGFSDTIGHTRYRWAKN